MSRRYYEVEKGDAYDGCECVTAWRVTRWVDGYGWQVAKYKDKERADEVADFLTRNSDNEVAP